MATPYVAYNGGAPMPPAAAQQTMRGPAPRNWNEVIIDGDPVRGGGSYLVGTFLGLVLGPIGLLLCTYPILWERNFARRYGGQTGCGILLIGGAGYLGYLSVIVMQKNGTNQGIEIMIVAVIVFVLAIALTFSSRRKWTQMQVKAKYVFANGGSEMGNYVPNPPSAAAAANIAANQGAYAKPSGGAPGPGAAAGYGRY